MHGLEDGTLDEYCHSLNLDALHPGTCEQLKKLEPQILQVIQLAAGFLSCDGAPADLAQLGDANACADVESFIALLKGVRFASS